MKHESNYPLIGWEPRGPIAYGNYIHVSFLLYLTYNMKLMYEHLLSISVENIPH